MTDGETTGNEPEDEDAIVSDPEDVQDAQEDSSDWTSSDEEDVTDEEPEKPAHDPLRDSAATIPLFSVECDSMITDVRFHQSEDTFVTADMDGKVKIWTLQGPSATLVTDLLPHRLPCRSVRFTKSGDLVSVGKDKRLCLIDRNQGIISKTFKKAHEASIYCVLPMGDNGIVTGDDDGCVKMWDTRSANAVVEFRDNNEFISALTCDKEEKIVLATSGDGTLSAFNVRRRRLDLQSEAFPAELLSVCIVKGGSKVVCGTGDGSLLVFKWGEWGYTLDQYPGREPVSIDAVEEYSPDLVFTASSDGNIRLISIMPYRMVGYAGYHSLPFERISLSPNKSMLASTSHDNVLRFWDVSRFREVTETVSDDSSDDDEVESSSGTNKRKKNSAKMPKRSKPAGNDFFNDL